MNLKKNLNKIKSHRKKINSVNFNSKNSGNPNVKVRVPQGFCLGPLLSNIYLLKLNFPCHIYY